MATIGKVSAVFTASTSGLTAGVNQASRAMQSMQGSVSGLQRSLSSLVAIQGAQLFGGIASGAASAARSLVSIGSSAFSGLRSAVDEATSLGEETSKSSVIFGTASAEIAKFAANASSIGLSEAAALQATGTFGNLFSAMGLGAEQSAEFSRSMTALGADLASFNNATVDESIAAIGAALRGESEPIRRFGVLLDEATLKQKALSLGLVATTTGSLTPAIKAQAAYAAILEQTTAAQGDFARTSGSLANLGRIVSAQTANIAGDVGKAFEPVFRSAADAISRTLDAVRPFVQEVANGVRNSIEVIAAAIQNLVPAFSDFLGGLDGGGLGEKIGAGIIGGARFLATIGDYIIQNVPRVWEYISQVGQQWSAVWDVGRRVAAFFMGIGNTLQAAFGVLVIAITGPVQGLIEAAKRIGDALFLDTSGLDTTLSAMRAFNQTIGDGITDNFNSAAENFSSAFGEASAQAGEALSGPLVTSLDAAIAAAEDARDQVDVAARQPVQVEQIVRMSGVREAVQGIDSRSAEGVREMFRIMRGGDTIPQQQLQAQLRIAAAVENQADGGIDLIEADIAQ